MTPETFLGLVSNLLFNYWSHGWPFLAAHAGLAIWFSLAFLKTHKEARSLDSWFPKNGLEVEFASIRIVGQFAAESETHGQSGSLIPMTDYSDRLDAYIDHTIAGLSSRANSFLLIGVMGTFFALFQFAFEVQSGLPPEQIGQRLSQGLAAAFPIGFIGLVLTMSAHLLTDWLEGRFRAAADEAVHKALNWRSENLKTVESHIMEAIEPLKNLEATLSRTLQPVIESFREQLQRMQAIMAEQVQPLARTISSLNDTNSRLAASVQQLCESAEQFRVSVREVHSIHQENTKALKQSRKLFEDLDSVVRASSDALTDASNRLAAVPQILSDRVGEKMEEITSRIETAWRESSSRLFNDLTSVSQGLKSSSSDLSSAAGQLRSLPENLSDEVKRSLQSQTQSLTVFIEEIRKEFQTALQNLMKSAEESWLNGAGTFVDRSAQAVASNLGEIRRASEEASAQLREAAARVIDLANKYTSTLENLVPAMLDESIRKLQPYFSQLDQAIRRDYPAALANLQEAVRTTKEFHDAASAVASDMQAIQSTISSAATRLKELLDALSSAGPDNGIQKEFVRLLEKLQNDLSELPSRIAEAFAISRVDGKPVLSVKPRPFWSRT